MLRMRYRTRQWLISAKQCLSIAEKNEPSIETKLGVCMEGGTIFTNYELLTLSGRVLLIAVMCPFVP